MVAITSDMMEVIKNFTQISVQGIVFPEGNLVRVADGGGVGVDRSAGRTIIAEAVFDESFDQGFAIHDSIQLYSALSMFEKPQIDIDRDTMKVVITNDGTNSGKFVFNAASPEVVKAPNEVKFPDDDANIHFRLTSDMYQRIFKGVGVVQAPEIMLYGADGQMFVSAHDIQDKHANTFIVPVGETVETFSVIVKIDSINKLLKSTDYDVTISPQGIMRAKSTNSSINICYYIAGTFQST
jgi:hypothetical protein